MPHASALPCSSRLALPPCARVLNSQLLLAGKTLRAWLQCPPPAYAVACGCLRQQSACLSAAHPLMPAFSSSTALPGELPPAAFLCGDSMEPGEQTCASREDESLGCVCSNLSLDRHQTAATCLQDPFCYGAYSYVPPNGRKVYYDWLSHPGELPVP